MPIVEMSHKVLWRFIAGIRMILGRKGMDISDGLLNSNLYAHEDEISILLTEALLGIRSNDIAICLTDSQ